ncbi:hypothetical protein [Gillisia sp. CAL575]|uniref:hypothetical protein n=1 Tax=Gillisia sp. CAL575 TaxID=985255 RepID=UPI00039A259F|nr:hypothetical protein [Gillisia sp. CAL575]
MKFNIKVRDVKFFILGIFAFFIFSVIYDWKDNVKSFREGFAKGEQANFITR